MDNFTDQPEDLPLGFMMQIGMDREAMNAFANLDESEKERMVNFIKSSITGEDAKERIAEVMNALKNNESFF